MGSTEKEQPHERERLTVRELADYLEIPLASAYRGLRLGQIPSRKVGRVYMIFRTAIDEWRRCKDGRTSAA